MSKQKSYYMKAAEVNKNWLVFDAKDQVLGRLASKVAKNLIGKEKPDYTPAMDMGDFVIVINADQVKVTGKKEVEKMYYHHSGYPGGLKSISLKDQRQKDATQIIRAAVLGMLPKNRLRPKLINHLKIYEGAMHPHNAQQPVSVNN